MRTAAPRTITRIGAIICLVISTISDPGAEDCPGLRTDDTSITVPYVAPPAYLGTIVDPISQVRITRITNNTGTIPGHPGSSWKSDAWGSRSAYPTMQAWNADGSLIYLNFGQLLIDARTYAVLSIGRLPFGHWSPVEPDIVWAVDDDTLVRFNARSGLTESRTTISGYRDLDIDVHSSPSADGTRLAVTALRISDQQRVAFVLDLPNRARIGRDITAVQAGSFTERYAADMTPSGRYMRSTFIGMNNTCMWWDYLTGTKVSEVEHHGMESPGHGDHAISATGRDLFVGVDKAGLYGGLMFVDPASGATGPVYRDGADHTSGRNLRRPGWVFCSDIRGEIAAVRLDGGRRERICHSYSRGTDNYWDQPQAIPSPDGRKVLFASDWDDQIDCPQSFVADFSDKFPGNRAPIIGSATATPQNLVTP